MTETAAALGARLDRATAGLDPPLAVVDLDAFDANAADLERRAAGVPIRVASKSVRVRALLERVLRRDGWAGVLAYTLPEALWLAETGTADDVLVAYPTADRAALRDLAARAAGGRPGGATAVMADDVAQLDLVAGAVREAGSAQAPVGVCLDVDASWRPLRGRLHVGVRRSPVHSPAQAAALAAEVVRRPELRLAGVMAYEAQIAGLADAPPSRVRGAAVRAMQRRSAVELARRRAAVVEAVREVAGGVPLVNGGGTGSLERTSAEACVTEVAAGSGLLAPTTFDRYTSFRPRPAALFALGVTRRPSPGRVTVLGGGWIASGPPGADRLPAPVAPEGLRLEALEGAGEVQTPLRGGAADALAIGDRVWLRHAKAGELCEHVDVLHLVRGEEVVDVVPTYRGEGRAFL
jgi:D-serine deaminase-like pyridoxal phosphate-dependent protein